MISTPELRTGQAQRFGRHIVRTWKARWFGRKRRLTFIRQVLVFLDSGCKDIGTDAKDTSVPYQGDTHSSTASSICNGQWCLRTRWRRYVKPIFLAWGGVQIQTVETVDGQINQTLNHHSRPPPPHPRFQCCLSEKMFCCQGFDLIRPLKPTSFTNRPTLNYGG